MLAKERDARAAGTTNIDSLLKTEELREKIVYALTELQETISALTNLQRLMIVLKLKKKPTRFIDLKESLGLKSTAETAYHLKKLVDSEIIEKTRIGKRYYYCLTLFGKALLDYLNPLILALVDVAWTRM